MVAFLFVIGWAIIIANDAVADAAIEGNAIRGAKVYERCVACHSLDRNRTGPKHCGIIGRHAGSVPGFDYSKAMRDSGIIWNRESLDNFLKAPLKVIPGTKMGYAGVKDTQERADLIAFLELATVDSEKCR